MKTELEIKEMNQETKNSLLYTWYIIAYILCVFFITSTPLVMIWLRTIIGYWAIAVAVTQLIVGMTLIWRYYIKTMDMVGKI